MKKNSSVLFSTVRKILLVGLLASMGMATLSAEGRTVQELAPGVYFYWGDKAQEKPANCLWVVFKDHVLVVDANFPWGAEEIVQDIHKTTSKPIRFLFDTYYHHDHSFGNQIFVEAGATIVSSTVTAEEMRGPLGQAEWNDMKDPGGHSMQAYHPEYPTLTFDHKLVFDDGAHRVELIRMGPGHTLGDAVAYLPKEKTLATGDLFVNGNPWGNNVADADANYAGWLKILDTLANWDVKIVVPGHGELGTTDSLRQERSYLADMLAQVKAGIKAGKSKDELVKEIDLSKHPVYGPNTVSNARSIRAMYNHVMAGKP